MKHIIALSLVLAALSPVSAAFASEGGRSFAVIPFLEAGTNADDRALGETIASYLSLYLSYQTGWENKSPAAAAAPAWQESDEPAAGELKRMAGDLGATALIGGTYREKSGAIRIAACLCSI